MGYPIRISVEGFVYHITVRGNGRSDIFLETRDFLRILKRLKEYKEKLKFFLYAYVLMPNHFHLLLEPTARGTITKIMQTINTAYTMYFNKKYSHVGHVFQGRFHSIIVEKEPYLLEVSRYIHLNPVRAGLVTKPEDYSWSSYRTYLGKEKNPLIDTQLVLQLFSQTPEKQKINYKEFVEAEIREPKFRLWENISLKQFIASDEFIKSTLKVRP
ncbi:transposase [Candidatus Gottesmanbacteria bacterium]|nr:transposase [Candidatus Gottesmanbacteria bacterium]